jgi:hypothetical protein
VTYDPEPRYPVAGGEVEVSYEVLAADVARRRPAVLAVDGPAALPWEPFIAALSDALRAAGLRIGLLDIRRSLAPWEEIQRRTVAAELPGDPVFARAFEGSLAELFDSLASAEEGTLVFGPGSALVDHDLLWYADLPKRLALEAVQQGRAGNVGQASGDPGSEQRLFFVDWPMLDRHKQALAGRLDQQNLHLAAPRHRAMLNVPRHDEKFAGAQGDGAIPQLDIEFALKHEEKIVGVFMAMPDELAFDPNDHDVIVIEPRNGARRPMVAEALQLLGEIDLLSAHNSFLQ